MSGAVLVLATSNSGSAPSGIILNDGYPQAVGSGVQTSTYRIDSDGYVYHVEGGIPTAQYQWNQSGNATSAYEAYAIVISGTVSGTAGSWVGLGTDRDWAVSDLIADGEGRFGTLSIQIRDVATSTVQASATIEFYADRWS